jgi:hypothetical protein
MLANARLVGRAKKTAARPNCSNRAIAHRQSSVWESIKRILAVKWQKRSVATEGIHWGRMIAPDLQAARETIRNSGFSAETELIAPTFMALSCRVEEPPTASEAHLFAKSQSWL